MAFLNLTHLHKTFGASVAVQDFSMQIERGEFISFLGPSGCGKTTVLRMVAGFERPNSGSITLDGNEIVGLNANKRNIGMVFQQYALFPNMNVIDNICFGMKVVGTDRATMLTRADEMLNLIHMREFAKRFPHQLSGGQQQRVALARALAIKPQVLLLDEPLSALDAKIRVELRREIRAIQRQLDITTIFVTHDQEEALSIADRIVVMNKGFIEQIGTPREIYNNPQTQFVASFIGTLNVLTAAVANRDAKKVLLDQQEIQVVDSLDSANGSVSLALRPESISLTRDDDHQNCVNAEVDELYFLGSVVRIRARLHEQFVNVDTFNNPGAALPARGDQIALYFSASAAKVLESDAAKAGQAAV
ncbi:MAG: ABC transporter ATP-binding protein [bacterium]|nr:ABC transporter ATP-binding protein [bacterium]